MKSYIAVIAAAFVLALAGLGAGLLWGPTAAPSDTPHSLRIGLRSSEVSAAFFVADEQGFFAQNGLEVETRPYATGEQAIAAAEAGHVEIGLTTEYPVVVAAFGNQSISVIGCIDRARTTSVIGRGDRGIAAVTDLRGKRVGLTRRTIEEFYLGRLLDLNGLNIGDVTVVDIPRPQNGDVVTNGSVDAVVAENRAVVPVTARLGGDTFVVSAHSDQPAFVLLVCDSGWGAAHPREIERLLTALAMANDYILANPADARATVGRRANLSEENMAALWPDHRFALSLEPSLLTAMNDEARWMIANNLTSATAAPDLREYIDTTHLAKVRPGAVTIL